MSRHCRELQDTTRHCTLPALEALNTTNASRLDAKCRAVLGFQRLSVSSLLIFTVQHGVAHAILVLVLTDLLALCFFLRAWQPWLQQQRSWPWPAMVLVLALCPSSVDTNKRASRCNCNRQALQGVGLFLCFSGSRCPLALAVPACTSCICTPYIHRTSCPSRPGRTSLHFFARYLALSKASVDSSFSSFVLVWYFSSLTLFLFVFHCF
jgi:hypothetical protein